MDTLQVAKINESSELISFLTNEILQDVNCLQLWITQYKFIIIK